MMLRIIQRSIATQRFLKFTTPIIAKSRVLVLSSNRFSTEAEIKTEDIHCIIKDTEKVIGELETQTFKAETKKLLDIVAKSLYSDKEIFIRELISNASDALEKLRYLRTTGLQFEGQVQAPLEIHIKTDENKNLFIIQDTGVGMTKEEIISNLGTIARSGSLEFMDKVQNENPIDSIIGKFGVGFYSSFMVADKVEVFSRSHKSQEGYYWKSSGTDGSFEISNANDVEYGTKIILHLKPECKEFADERSIDKIVNKYSSYVGSNIFLNGKKLTMMQPLWLKDQSKISEAEHDSFYQYISGNMSDVPRYTFNFKFDVPIDLKSLFYVPSRKPTLYEISRESDAGVSLYSRKIMIMNRTQKLLPNWLRFLKGVVESDDIPLNLSRELLQDSALISKINRVLTGKIVKYFLDQAKRDNTKYLQFYHDFGLYLKEGIINTIDQTDKENIAKLLRFESNKLPAGEYTNFQDYADRMAAGTRKIYFFSAPNRHVAETSPYIEAITKKDVEVLFLFEPYDEVVVMQLGQFNGKSLVSIETEHSDDASNIDSVDSSNEHSITQQQAEELTSWIEQTMKPKIARAKITRRLSTHPCLVSVKDMGAVRYFIRTSPADRIATDDERYLLMNATLELNPAHVLVNKLVALHKTDETLARLLVNQLFQNALVQAGLVTDARPMMADLNELLARAFDKL